MNAPSTCGQGLATNAGLPDRMARLAAATAAVLDAHQRAAQLLRDASRRMTGARALPMGRHIDDAGVNAAMGEAFAEFVASESALHAALAARIDEDRQMLDGMR